MPFCGLYLAVAVEMARQEWNAKQKDELNVALEATNAQLMKQFEEQKKEAVEKAVSKARVRLISLCVCKVSQAFGNLWLIITVEPLPNGLLGGRGTCPKRSE